MMGRKRAITLCVLTVMLVHACDPGGDDSQWPTEAWPACTPEQAALDPIFLKGIHSQLSAKLYGYVDRFLLIMDGCVVADRSYEHDYERANLGRDPVSDQYNYYDPNWHPFYKGSDLHTLQSVTKSVTGLVVGMAIERGELPETDVAVLDYFEAYEIQNLDDVKRRMTLEDLLTMRAGLQWDESTYAVEDPRNSVNQLEASDDWIQFVLDLPMADEPGEVWVYSSGASQLLSAIVRETTGRHVDEYAETYLFKPLGISEYYWKKTPKGWPDTEGGLYLKAEDLAKIGYLLLHGGTWDGEQIVSSEWVVEMTGRKVEDIAPMDPEVDWGYGYLWWLLGGPAEDTPRVIAALGYGGQYLFVVPDLDLVAVFNGWNIYGARRSVIELFMQEIVPAVMER